MLINPTNNIQPVLDTNLFEIILNRWLDENPSEFRILAKEIIWNFYTSSEETILLLSGFSLTSLPDIFHLEPFRSRLEGLFLADNQLISLPTSFGRLKGLTRLDLEGNKLTTLPEFFIHLENLTDLNLENNQLISLPESFGGLKKLTKLRLDKNKLTTLPISFGNLQKLMQLTLENNALTTLPESFVHLEKLTVLDLGNNQFISLPEFFGGLKELTRLYLDNNQFIRLSAFLGNLQALLTLSLKNNSTLSGIPMHMLDLPSSCTIDLTGCNLSQAVLERLRETITSVGYQGPCISFSMSGRNRNEEKPIEESLKDLYDIADKTPMKFSLLEETVTLCSWLSRLSNIADYQKQGALQKAFVNKIIDYLNQANENQEFCKIFYTVIWDASETCGDRMALSVLHLGIAYKLATIDLKDMKNLVDFLKGVWAIELLEEIARKKISALKFFDEIEVYLGYLVKLKEVLNLPIDIQEMLYFTYSALESEDLEEAKNFVLSNQADQESYFKFLIGHDKWKEALATNYKEEYVAILKKRADSTSKNPNYETIEEKFNQELMDLTKRAFDLLNPIVSNSHCQATGVN